VGFFRRTLWICWTGLVVIPIPSGFPRRFFDWIIRLAGDNDLRPGWHFGSMAGIHHRDAADGGAGRDQESAETTHHGASEIGGDLVFVGFAARFIKPAHWHPFAPNGWPGF